MKRIYVGLVVLLAVFGFSVISVSSTADNLLNITFTEISEPVTNAEDDFVGELPRPIIMSFSDETSFRNSFDIYTASNNSAGLYEFCKLPDGTGCLKLNYLAFTNWPSFRVMPKFLDSSMISHDYNYARITYMTEDVVPASIALTNNAVRTDTAIFTHDASVSDGKWVTSNAVFIDGGDIVTRFANGMHCMIEYNANIESSALYIKELAFFATEKQAYDYYGDAPARDYSYSVMDFGSTYVELLDKPHDYSKFFDASKAYNCRYNAAINPGDTEYSEENLNYCVIKYQSKNAGAHSLYLWCPDYHADGRRGEKIADIAADTNGWTNSNVIEVTAGLQTRIKGTGQITIVSDSSEDDARICIGDIIFFNSKEDAEKYIKQFNECSTGESAAAVPFDGINPENYSVVKWNTGNLKITNSVWGNDDSLKATLAVSGTGKINNDRANYGTNSINPLTNAVDIVYGEGNFHGIQYMAKLGFQDKYLLRNTENYVRVLYSAQNPEGTTGASLFILNDGDKELIELQKNVKDTNGGFVLSDTAYLPDNIITRLAGTDDKINLHLSFCSTAKNLGGMYSIKAVYFFSSREAADAFTLSDTDVRLTVCGNDIADYSIVIPDTADSYIRKAAEALRARIDEIAGVKLPIVSDKQVYAHEILIGRCEREESDELYSNALSATYGGNGVQYEFAVINGKAVFNGVESFAVMDGVNLFIENYLFGSAKITSSIDINERYNHGGSSYTLINYPKWNEKNNVDTPTVISDDFSSDNEYFTEDNGADNAKIENGVLTLSANELSASYVHVYESNVRFDARVKYVPSDSKGGFGLMLRTNSPEAYVRGGYDNETGELYIEFREGLDFAPRRVAKKSGSLASDTWYDFALTTDGHNVVLEVNGENVLSADNVKHVTPGRPGIFAEKSTIALDSFSLTLLSGEGTVIRGISHTKLPDETYREGGTVYEMNDGSLHYETHHKNAAFKSLDGGRTWQRSEAIFKFSTYPQAFRLNNGDFIFIAETDVDGERVWKARLSSDEGKTWRDGGVVCPHFVHTKRALNMNDKITQSARTGRIYYVQSHTGNVSDINGNSYGPIELYYYSDDNGITWNKSETDSWEIPGNEAMVNFTEGKMIDCADGTVRVYNSWNNYSCIAYSESTDGGRTFGPIVLLPEFECTCSSMQIVRDPYADNDTTYYMVWVNCGVHRSRLSLARSEDGKNWNYIGDLWRWEPAYRYNNESSAPLNHVVDPFVAVTKNAIIVGTGLSEYMTVDGETGYNTYHRAQRQHIWTIDRDTVGTGKPMNKYTDIDKGAPYYEAVTYVSNQKLFTGTSETTFSPDTTMTRAMFVTVLGRLDGADVSKYAAPTFSDVIAGQWYTTYVEWAAANKIVNGIGNGEFGVNGTLSVEQACVMLARYAGGKTVNTQTGVSIHDFSDGAEVSAWAIDAVEWALNNGIYTGQNGKLKPTAPASRSLVATMFANYVAVYGN